MYVNITHRRVEVSNKASMVDGIHTKSYCVLYIIWLSVDAPNVYKI